MVEGPHLLKRIGSTWPKTEKVTYLLKTIAAGIIIHAKDRMMLKCLIKRNKRKNGWADIFGGKNNRKIATWARLGGPPRDAYKIQRERRDPANNGLSGPSKSASPKTIGYWPSVRQIKDLTNNRSPTWILYSKQLIMRPLALTPRYYCGTRVVNEIPN